MLLPAILGWARPVCAALAVVFVAMVATPMAVGADRKYPSTDVLETVSPQSEVPSSRLMDRHPLSNYTLDYHVDSPSASITTGGPKINTGLEQTPGLVMQTITNAIWGICATISSLVIKLFTWAFSVDLLQPGSSSGPLGEVADTITNDIYGADGSGIIGREWMAIGVLLAGCWAMWQGLVKRRYAETVSALGLSVLFMGIALAFVLQPRETVGEPIQWTNQVSASFLTLAGGSSELYTDRGGAEGGTDKGNSAQIVDAKTKVSDALFQRLIYDPWVVLEFGGLKHCTKGENQLVPPSEARARGASCIDHKVPTREGGAYRGGYAERFLAFSPDSTARKREVTALREGKIPDEEEDGGGVTGAIKNAAADTMKSAVIGPFAGAVTTGKQAREAISGVGGGEEISAKDQFAGWKFDPRDQPASDLQRADSGAAQRLAMASLVLIGSIGAWMLIGGASVAVIFAQMFVLVLLAFAPVMLVVGMFPGRGHQVFMGWLTRLGTQILKKAIYALILAICLAVSGALLRAVNEDWLLAFAVQALFYWSVFLYRNDLAGMLVQATTGGRMETDYSRKLQSAYYASKTAAGPLRSLKRRAGQSGGKGGSDAPAVPAAATMGGAPGAISVAALSLGKQGLDRVKDTAEREKDSGTEKDASQTETPMAAAAPVGAPSARSRGEDRERGNEPPSSTSTAGGGGGEGPMAPIRQHEDSSNGSSSSNGSGNGSSSGSAATSTNGGSAAGAAGPPPARPRPQAPNPPPAERPSPPAGGDHPHRQPDSPAADRDDGGRGRGAPKRDTATSPLAQSLDDEDRRGIRRRRRPRPDDQPGGDT